MNRLILALLAAAAPVLTGCVVIESVAGPREDYSPTAPLELAPPPNSNGSIYAAGYDVRLFEDLKARRVGDTLTIRLVERTDARKSASTSTSKSDQIDIPGPIIGGRPVTANGTEILNTSIDADRAFDGEGDSSQSNSLTGSVTVTVARVLPNGNLEIRGEKWININQGEEFVRVSGIVRPFDVLSDNSVLSSSVANARFSYSGTGAIADANAEGWLTRFFNSPIFPF